MEHHEHEMIKSRLILNSPSDEWAEILTIQRVQLPVAKCERLNRANDELAQNLLTQVARCSDSAVDRRCQLVQSAPLVVLFASTMRN